MPLPDHYISNRAIVIGGGKKRIVPSTIVHDSFVNEIAADDDGISASHAGAATAGTTSQTIGGSFAVGGVATLPTPRSVVVKVTHASAIVAMSGTITGTDQYGSVISEAWSVTATGTSKSYETAKLFKTVTSITETVAADASANTIISGNGTTLALSAQCSCPKAVMELADGAVVTTGTLASVSGTQNGSFKPATAPDGAHDYDVWYLSDYPEESSFVK